MKKLLTSLICLTSILIFSLPAAAQFGEPLNPIEASANTPKKSQYEFISSVNSIKPGQTFKVALKLSHPKKWHSYYINDGIGVSVVPSIKWTLPEGFTASSLIFPAPHSFKYFGLNSYGYEGTNYFITEITAPDDLKDLSEVSFTASAKWQICDDTGCIQEATEKVIPISIDTTGSENPEYAKALGDYEAKHTPTYNLPDDWKIGAKEENDQISITLITPKKFPTDLEFFDSDAQIDAQKEIKINSQDGTLTISGSRNNGNSFVADASKKENFIRGILYSKSSALLGDSHAIFITSQWGEPKAIIPASAIPKSAPTTSQGVISLDGKTERKFTLLTVIPFALLAGLILNIMPCVFPVLGLKITGFAQQAGEDASKIKWHGLIFGLGIVVSMWALAGILIILKLLGKDIGWGFQLQSPTALAVILIIMFIMGLNLSGLFEMGTKLTGVGGELQTKKGYSGSFFSGLLTTLIATPCSAPIVAPVMGYATGLDPVPALFVFTIFALGIASPYIILSFMPKLIQKLPKPGAWMITFKKVMAFPMYAAVIFFFGAFMTLTGKSGAQALLWSFLAITIGLYIYGQWAVPYKPKPTRYKAILGTLLFAGLAYWTTSKAVHSKPPNSAGGTEITADGFVWEEWSIEKVAELRASGKRVYVDFTGDN